MQQTRELSKAELVLANRDVVTNLVVSATLITKVYLDTERLKKAVYLFIKSQPNLSSGLEKVGQATYFKPLKDILDYFEVLPKEQDWKEFCIEYSNKHLRNDFKTFPPFKVFFIQPSVKVAYLIPIGSHYAMDGTNSSSSISDILDIYSKLKDNPEHKPKQFLAAPSIDQIRNSILTQTEIKDAETAFKDYSLKIFDSVNCTIPIQNESTAKIMFLPYSSSEAVYSDLREVCRNMGSTLGAVMCAAKCFGFAACIFSRQNDLPEELFLNIEIPINIRGRMLPMDQLPWSNVNFSVNDPYIGIGVKKTTTFWDLVKSVKNEFDYLLNGDRKLYIFDMFNFADMLTTDKEKEIFAKGKEVQQGVLRHFCFSNIKWFPGEMDHEEFTVDALYCTGGTWLYGGSISESFVYTTRKLNYTMLYREGDENEDCAREVLHYFKYFMENAKSLQETNISVEEAINTIPYKGDVNGTE